MPRWKNRPPGSNWGDFGADDQLGRMNLLTPERRLAAVREVREGIAFALSLPLDYPGGEKLAIGRKPPRLHAVENPSGGPKYNLSLSQFARAFTDVVCDDAVTLHTQYSTQWDSLAHVGSEFDADGDGVPEKVFYNGFRAGEHVVGPEGDQGRPCARALGIENMASVAIQGRGVLADLNARYGRDAARVGYDDLMRVLEEQGAEVAIGDFLCLYTGFADVVLEQNRNPDPGVLHHVCAGLDGGDAKLLQWITDSGIVAICADNWAVEVVNPKPRSRERHAMLPLHEHCLFKQGIHLGELWYLTELASWLRKSGRSHFLLTAPPLRLPGSVGSPVTPIATV